jgi:hypothetical protein
VNVGGHAPEARRMKLLRQLQEGSAYLFCIRSLGDAERSMRALRDAHLHLGEHGARP